MVDTKPPLPLVGDAGETISVPKAELDNFPKDIKDNYQPSQSTPDKYRNQYFAAFSATLLLLAAGTASGWASPAIPKLTNEETSPIPITADESSWIVSLMEIGVLVVAVPAAWIMDRFGRRFAIIVGIIPITIAWIIFATAETVELLYVARILCGLTYGLCYTVVPMYLGEIASDRIRGAVSLMLTIMMKSGILLVYVIGRYAEFRTLAYLNLIPALCFMCLVYWMPETPYYLLAKQRETEARRNLVWLRGHQDVGAELDKMQESVRNSFGTDGTIRELFYVRGNRRAFFIVICLTAVQILCGSQVIVAYAETIFLKVGSGLDANGVSIIIGVVQFISAAFSASVVDRIGRRPLLMLSISGMIICNFLVGLYFNLIRQDVNVSGLDWLPTVAIVAFVVCYVMGMATVIFALLGEIFPSNMKAIAGALYTVTSSALSFGVHKLFQVVSDGWGSDVTFWGFALFGVIFFPFIWFMVPETKGKSLDEILEQMNAPGSPRKYDNKIKSEMANNDNA